MLHIEIPDEIVHHLRLPPERIPDLLREELAVQLVREGICTAAQGSRLARLPRLVFEQLLGQRKVAWSGTVEDVKQDLATLESS